MMKSRGVICISRYAALDLFDSKTIEEHRVFQGALLVM